MTDLIVTPQEGPLLGSVPLPSDKSIGHVALLFASLAEGNSEIRRFSYGEDNVATQRALVAMGIEIDDDRKGTLRVRGAGLRGLRAPHGALHCGNCGTTMRLLAGVLAAQTFRTVLVGDALLSREPMATLATPLRRRGAQIEGFFSPKRVGEITAPLTIGPLPRGHELSGLEHELTSPNAHVKGALLVSGLYASEPTFVREPILSRDHTERMLQALGVPLTSAGPIIGLDPSAWDSRLPSFELEVPGDFSAAAFVLAAGLLVPESRVTTRRTGINPTRTGALDLLRPMGARLEVQVHESALGEPQAVITASSSELRGTTIAGEILVRAIDEMPILGALGARARGVTVIADAAELRVEGRDRIAEMIELLRAFGVDVEEHADGMSIEGRPAGPLRAASVDCHGDPRIGMTAAILGLLGDGPTSVRDVACIGASFPRFVGTMRALGARIEVIGAS